MINLSRKKFEENKKEIIEKYLEGYTIKELGIIYNIQRYSLKQYLVENGIKTRVRGQFTERQKQRMRQAFIEKYGCENISQTKRVKEIVSKKLSIFQKGKWSGEKNPNFGNKIGKNNGYHYGYREDLGNIFWRSSWEANVARFFNFKKINWAYEPKRFKLSTGETYTPDFFIEKNNCYIEVKGWWREDAIRKFKLFKEEYEDIKIKIIDKDKYTWIVNRYSENILFEGNKQ